MENMVWRTWYGEHGMENMVWRTWYGEHGMENMVWRLENKTKCCDRCCDVIKKIVSDGGKKC